MEGSAASASASTGCKNDEESSNRLKGETGNKDKKKPPFRIAKDDTKPLLQDPLWSSDPTQNEEAVLRLPPLCSARSKSRQP